MAATNVVPLRPFENAIRQALRMRVPTNRQECVRRVLREINAGRNGQAVAAELQRNRLQADDEGDAA
jgi:hypothetical protein